jgi:hypothetical protein
LGHWGIQEWSIGALAHCGIQEWSIASNAALMQSNSAMPQLAIAE